jgi:hypothetical protein
MGMRWFTDTTPQGKPMERCGAIIIGVLTCLGIFAFNGSVGAAEATFCDGYARQAADEAVLALKFHCDFHGWRWVTDIETHLGWCLGTPKAAVEDAAAARANDVRLCTCQWYADRTIEQVAISLTKACNFTGPRWSEDRSAHYRWCVLYKVPLAELESEIKTREGLLAKCAS